MTRRTAVKLWTWRRMLRDHGPPQPGLLLTLYTIGTWMDSDGYCYPSQKEIAKGARVSDRTVKRHVEQARKLGWLHTEPGPMGGKGWRLTAYFATVPEAIELPERDEELTDCLHSQVGNVGEQYPEGGDTIVSPRPPVKVVTSDAKVGTPVTEGGDTGDHIVGTQSCPTNSSLNSPKELFREEGRASARPLPEDGESRRRNGMRRASTIVADGSSESLHEKPAQPPTIDARRKARILQLLTKGYGLTEVARMACMEPAEVEAIVSEIAA